jgi:hypothetical protein
MEPKPKVRPTAPKPPTIDHLEALSETLEVARQEVVDLCESLVDTALLSTWEVAPAVTAWQQAAEAWNEAVSDAAADVRGFMEAHSERWLESERGQAYDTWADALEGAAVETEPTDVLRLSLSIDLTSGQIEGTVENADDVLPETPEIPALEA